MEEIWRYLESNLLWVGAFTFFALLASLLFLFSPKLFSSGTRTTKNEGGRITKGNENREHKRDRVEDPREQQTKDSDGETKGGNSKGKEIEDDPEKEERVGGEAKEGGEGKEAEQEEQEGEDEPEKEERVEGEEGGERKEEIEEGKEEEEEEKQEKEEKEEEEEGGWLPDEIYFEIFSYLSAEEMEPLSCISWNWKNIVEDSRLWVSLYDELCDEEEVPIKEKVKSMFQPHVNWKTKYFITSRFISADRTEKWKTLLDSLMEGATHGFITDHEMHVIVMSENLKLRVTELDDIFKGVGVKGKYPIPILLRIGKGTYTVLSSTNNYFSGLSIVARDLNTSTGLVIVKTRKLILVVLKERCYYFEQIGILQTVFRVSDHLLEQGY